MNIVSNKIYRHFNTVIIHASSVSPVVTFIFDAAIIVSRAPKMANASFWYSSSTASFSLSSSKSWSACSDRPITGV